MKKILIVVLLVALGGGALWWFTQPAADAPAAPKVAEMPTAPKPATPAPMPKPPAPPTPSPAALPAAMAVPTSAQPAPITSLDSATLEALKQGLSAYKRAEDFQKMDPTALSMLKDWAAQNSQAVITWLDDIPEDNKNREHAFEAMISLEIKTRPQVALDMANAIGDDTVRSSRVGEILVAMALTDPAAAAAAVKTANIPEDERSKIANAIQAIQTNGLTDDMRAKITETIQKMSE